MTDKKEKNDLMERNGCVKSAFATRFIERARDYAEMKCGDAPGLLLYGEDRKHQDHVIASSGVDRRTHARIIEWAKGIEDELKTQEDLASLLVFHSDLRLPSTQDLTAHARSFKDGERHPDVIAVRVGPRSDQASATYFFAVSETQGCLNNKEIFEALIVGGRVLGGWHHEVQIRHLQV